MSEFKREFDFNGAKKALEAPENAWFKDLLRAWRPAGHANRQGSKEEDHLRLAVRNGYLNFYRAGQSVAKVGFANDALQWEIHNKYVDKTDERGDQHYVKITAGRYKGRDGAHFEYHGDLLRSWIQNAYQKSKTEKQFVDMLIDQRPGVIDMEAALPSGPGESAPRMDLVTLEPCGDHYRLAFWEVKVAGNPEARSEGAFPKVVDQLRKYETWIGENRELVCGAYRSCCTVLVELHRIAAGLRPDIPALGKPIVAVGQDSTPLCVDLTPRLILDARGGEGVFRKNGHLKKLQDSGICVQMIPAPADLAVPAHA